MVACCSVRKSALSVFCLRACWRCRAATSSVGVEWCGVTSEGQADDVNVWCHCTGWLTCFFSLSVCLLQQWETFSERSSSSQTLTQFDSNIAPADPVSQSLSMHGFTINGQTLTLSRSLCFLSLSLSLPLSIYISSSISTSLYLSVSLCAWCSFKVQSAASAVVSVLWFGWLSFYWTSPFFSTVTSTNH